MPYTHGGDIYGDAAVELDFSVNINRLGNAAGCPVML